MDITFFASICYAGFVGIEAILTAAIAYIFLEDE